MISSHMKGKVNQVWSTHHYFVAIAVGTLSLVLMFGCIGMPTLPEQEQKILSNDLTLRKLEPRAFVRAWGQPTYQHMEFMPFFGMKDGSLVPRSRLAVGEAPPGWEAGVDAGDVSFSPTPTEAGWSSFSMKCSCIEKNSQPKNCMRSAIRGHMKRSFVQNSRSKQHRNSPFIGLW